MTDMNLGIKYLCIYAGGLASLFIEKDALLT